MTDAQHLGFDRYCDDRAILEAREARFLAACLTELGGNINDPWRFDRASRTFYREVPDEPGNPSE